MRVRRIGRPLSRIAYRILDRGIAHSQNNFSRTRLLRHKTLESPEMSRENINKQPKGFPVGVLSSFDTVRRLHTDENAGIPCGDRQPAGRHTAHRSTLCSSPPPRSAEYSSRTLAPAATPWLDDTKSHEHHPGRPDQMS